MRKMPGVWGLAAGGRVRRAVLRDMSVRQLPVYLQDFEKEGIDIRLLLDHL